MTLASHGRTRVLGKDYNLVLQDPVTGELVAGSGQSLQSVDPNGTPTLITTNSAGQTVATVVGGSLGKITNYAALAPVAAALRGASASEVLISGVGDSLTQLGGDTVAQSSDTLAESQGFLAHLRRNLNARLGTSTYDGGQWIGANAVASDARVANGGAPTVVPQYCPFVGWRNSSSVTVFRNGVALQGVGQTITFTVSSRYLKVLQWENAGNSYNGTFSYQIDGGSVNNIVSSGATDTYRFVTIDLGTQAAHTVVLTWVSAKVMVAGAYTSNGAGVITTRFGAGGTTTVDWAGRQTRERLTSFATFPAVLQIIRFSYNDWQKQATGGQLTTPALFSTTLQSLIAQAQANASTKAILLMVDPPTSTADSLTAKYDEYRLAAKALATGSVAFYDVAAAANASYSTGNTLGYYVDAIHRTGLGYSVEAAALADALLEPNLLVSA